GVVDRRDHAPYRPTVHRLGHRAFIASDRSRPSLVPGRLRVVKKARGDVPPELAVQPGAVVEVAEGGRVELRSQVGTSPLGHAGALVLAGGRDLDPQPGGEATHGAGILDQA